MGEEGRASEKLDIICRCGARKAPDEQFCDYCYAMAEEPGTYWDENIGWCFNAPLRSSSAGF
jgi:hypothetical protein